MKSNYSKVFSGNQFLARKIANQLHEIGIAAILKDESESGRMGGFVSTMDGDIEIYVHEDELEKTQELIRKVS